MPQPSRRHALKGLAVAIPAAWTTPVIQSISLPAHAQTSPAGPADPPVTTDIIAGRLVNCEDQTLFCERFSYGLVNGNIVRTTSSCGGSSSAFIEVSFFERSSGFAMGVAGNSDGGSFSIVWPCAFPATRALNEPFQIDGVPYTVSFEISGTSNPPGVLLSDITVASE